MTIKSLVYTALYCFVILTIGQKHLLAQNNPVQLANTHQFNLHANTVDDDFEIMVGLPFGYEQSNTKYKVLYVLDANVSFGMARDIQTLISFEPENPPMIIVGIGYKDFGNWIQKRARDYMPTKVENLPGSGGADQFLKFIETQLIPEIDQRYRTTNSRIIYGHSTAGLFGLYTLLNKSELFDGYIITSPSVDEDGGYSLSLLKATSFISNKSARVFTSYGTKEKRSFVEAYDTFIKTFKKTIGNDLTMKSEQIDASHMVSMAPAFVAGMQFMNQNN